MRLDGLLISGLVMIWIVFLIRNACLLFCLLVVTWNVCMRIRGWVVLVKVCLLRILRSTLVIRL